MSMERIRALIALAVDNPTSEEARTAAVQACQQIVKANLLGFGEPSSVARFPGIHDRAGWEEWMRAEEARRAAETAAHGPGVHRIRLRRRAFCFRCKSMIEETDESVQHETVVNGRLAHKYECLHCFDKVAAPVL